MGKIKNVLKSGRVIILIIALLTALLAIWPSPGREGVVISGVEEGSFASLLGLSADLNARPTSRELIEYVDGKKILTVDDYWNAVSNIEPNATVFIETDEAEYRVRADNESNLGIQVAEAAKTNVKKGLDLQGGTRVILKPEFEVDERTLDTIAESLKIRLNAFGLSDIAVKKITFPEQYILIEVAGATEQEVSEKIAKQGVFEAKIGNDTVYEGEEIKYVGRSAQDSQITTCGTDGQGYSCGWQFVVSVTPEAANRFSKITQNLSVIGTHLDKTLDLYLDGDLINNLSIQSSLKGQVLTSALITGGAQGAAENDAYANAQDEMDTLQTILETGSLPVRLDIVSNVAISPLLGKEFTKNAILVGLLAVLTVTLVIFIRFRKLSIAVPMFIAMVSEVVLLLGLAAVINWQLDLAAIAGIIVAAGTGVDDQIVIVAEVLRGEIAHNWKQKIQKAFFIIMAAYFTTVVAMVPLMWAGAGLLKGFAFTTIAGVSFGVFITRPAFASMIERLLR